MANGDLIRRIEGSPVPTLPGGDPFFPLGDIRDPFIPPARPEIPFRPPAADVDPNIALQPPVAPGPVVPPTQIFIPDAPVAPGPGLGALIGRVGFGAAIGVIAVELLSEIARTIQESRFRALEEEREAEIRMTRGRILAREKIEELEVELEPGGDLAIPPPGRDVGLSDQDRFPFPDPFENPLGDAPLPDTRPPGAPIIPVPLPSPEPVTAPLPAPIGDPTPQAPTLPQTAPAPAPGPGPGTRPLPTPSPSPSPSPAPGPSAPPRTSPFSFPFPIPFGQPSAQPRPLTGPGQPTPTPTDIPLPDLTTFESPGVPLQQPVRDSRCPPCEQEELEPRTECFKKLVIENVLPDNDETFNWIEVDCFTGKEIG